jgi:hypothetical protein
MPAASGYDEGQHGRGQRGLGVCLVYLVRGQRGLGVCLVSLVRFGAVTVCKPLRGAL